VHALGLDVAGLQRKGCYRSDAQLCCNNPWRQSVHMDDMEAGGAMAWKGERHTMRGVGMQGGGGDYMEGDGHIMSGMQNLAVSAVFCPLLLHLQKVVTGNPCSATCWHDNLAVLRLPGPSLGS
jgi:hypothetical protein